MSDAKKLEKFYSTEQGKIFSWFLRREVSKAIASENKIIGLGYTAPYHLPNCVNLSTEKAKNSVQISEAQLPLRNAELKQIIAIHYLENSATPMLALQEIYRVLEPAGSLILIVPKQNSLWKKTAIIGKESWTQRQIIEMLIANKFHIHKVRQAIFHPPALTSPLAKLFNYLPFFGAVNIYYAQKTIFPNRGKPIKTSTSLRDWVLSKKKIAQA